MSGATEALARHLTALDSAYATGEARRFLSVQNTELGSAERGTLKELADWAAALPARLS